MVLDVAVMVESQPQQQAAGTGCGRVTASVPQNRTSVILG